MLKEVTIGQVRHALTGLGYAVVALGLMSEPDAMDTVQYAETVLGAVMALVGHVLSAVNKRKPKA